MTTYRGNMHGPWQRIETPVVFGWIVVAEEKPQRDMSVDWDVFAFRNGERVTPIGPNLHRNPDAEVRRLCAVIETLGTGVAMGAGSHARADEPVCSAVSQWGHVCELKAGHVGLHALGRGIIQWDPIAPTAGHLP